uniref:Uncharacterized protein n=1 Tax=Anguilla anguilla TaxID=7936 RepID=A0A0E9R2E4_ANGAN
MHSKNSNNADVVLFHCCKLVYIMKYRLPVQTSHFSCPKSKKKR